MFVVIDYFSRCFEVDVMKTVATKKVMESSTKVLAKHNLPNFKCLMINRD